jgi:hypothetical protein
MADDYWIKMQKLVERLDYATDTKQISWGASINTESFQVDVGNSTVSLSSRDGDGAYPFELVIQDGSGSVIDSVSSDEVDFGDLIRDLYQKSRRSAKGIDRAIDEIIYALPEPPSEQSTRDDPWNYSPPKSGGYDDEPPF